MTFVTVISETAPEVRCIQLKQKGRIWQSIRVNMNVIEIPSPCDNSELARTITSLSLGVTRSRNEPVGKEEEHMVMPPQIPDLIGSAVHFFTVFAEPSSLPEAVAPFDLFSWGLGMFFHVRH